MESISIAKGATSVKKEAEKVQRQKSLFFLHKYHMLLFSGTVTVTVCSKQIYKPVKMLLNFDWGPFVKYAIGIYGGLRCLVIFPSIVR